MLFRNCPKKQSLCVQALLSLHEYIEPSSLKEVVSTLLLLPQKCLVAPENQLSVYGHAVLKLLSEDHSSCIALSQAHLRGLAALLTSCQCVQLEDFLLQVQITVKHSTQGPDILMVKFFFVLHLVVKRSLKYLICYTF